MSVAVNEPEWLLEVGPQQVAVEMSGKRKPVISRVGSVHKPEPGLRRHTFGQRHRIDS